MQRERLQKLRLLRRWDKDPHINLRCDGHGTELTCPEAFARTVRALHRLSRRHVCQMGAKKRLTTISPLSDSVWGECRLIFFGLNVGYEAFFQNEVQRINDQKSTVPAGKFLQSV